MDQALKELMISCNKKCLNAILSSPVRTLSWELFHSTIKNVDNKVYNTNTTEYAVNYINSLFRIDFKNHLKAFEFIMSTTNRHYTSYTPCISCMNRICSRQCSGISLAFYDNSIIDYNSLFTSQGFLLHNYIDILPQDIIELVYKFDMTYEEELIYSRFTLGQLKHFVQNNQVVLQKYLFHPLKPILPHKKYWVKVYVDSKKWSFHVFAAKSRFCDDILGDIQTYLI